MSSSKPPLNSQPAPAEINQQYSKFKNDLTGLAQKIGELESEGEEHSEVLSILRPFTTTDPSRKAFRLIGGVLVERTVVEVVPELEKVVEGIRGSLEMMVKQYKSTEDEFSAFQKKYNIQVVTR